VTLLALFLAYALALSVALARSGHRSGAGPTQDTSDRSIKRVLIVGATGGTGQQLVRQALERGYVVTALVRNPKKINVLHPRLTVTQGDVLDAAAVAQAVQGQDAVVSALGHRRYFGPTRILSDGTRNLVRAMQAHGVRRLVCETSLGIGDSAGRMGVYYTFFVIPLILPFYFWDKTRQERVIAATDLDWVTVRPGVLTTAAPRGRYRHGDRIGSFVWTVRISRADVAAFMLDQLTSHAYLRRAVGVCW
jgi:putative NADH-flavin reductase